MNEWMGPRRHNVAVLFSESSRLAYAQRAAQQNQTYTFNGADGEQRIWLKGEQAGKKELFLDLPGFPDNVRYSKSRHVFWVAIGSPRNPMVDDLAGSPTLRKVITRLPKAVQPKPERHAIVIAVDENGKVVDNLQYRAPDSFSPVASAVEHDGWLYLGSFIREGVARVRLP